MKKFLLLLFLAVSSIVSAQNAALCEEAYSLCGSLGIPFPNTTGTSAQTTPISTYGCLGSQPNPVWFYFSIAESGPLAFIMNQVSENGTPIDVDFICYGPYSSPEGMCNNAGSNNIVDCSYSASATEQLDISNAQAGEYYLLMITNFNGSPGFITIENALNGTGVIGCSGININAFIDANANGVRDANETNFPFGVISYEANNSGTVHEVNDSDGFFTIYDEDPAASYDFSYSIPEPYTSYYSVSPASYQDINPQAPGSIQTYEFPISIIQSYQDLSVNLIASWGSPAAGFSHHLTVAYTNLGPETVSGTVAFTKDNAFTITSVSSPDAIITLYGFELPFTDLAPLEIRYVTVYMDVPAIPTVTLGQLTSCSASITPVADDVNPTNNLSELSQEIVASYDPNDITESHGREIIAATFTENDYLYYTIRFQNLGTAPAHNVRIEEVLDAQIDASTLTMLSSSHSYELDRTGSNLSWKFNDIMLPAAQDDEAGSNGYVYFKVKPLPGIQAGDMIPASAGIYFDFNPVVETNTFTTEFVTALSTATVTPKAFTLYPNPATGRVNITSVNGIDTVKIYDITGKVLLSKAYNGALQTTIDTASLSAGTYFVEAQQGNTHSTLKLIKL